MSHERPGHTCGVVLQPDTYFGAMQAMTKGHSLVMVWVISCALKKLPTKLSRATVHLFVSLANNGFETSAVNKQWQAVRAQLIQVEHLHFYSMLMADPVFPQ